MTKGGRRHLEILALAALVIVFLWDPRLLAPGSFIGGEDVELGHYWYKTYLKERLQGLALPLWAPQFFGGHPFLAYPEMCVFYPTTLLFVLLPIPVAFTLNYGIHLLVAAWGARSVIGLFSPSRSAGFVSAVCYAFGGYMADRLHSGHITYVQSAAWLPWVFWAMHRAHASGSWRDRVVAAILFALLVLASPPHNAMYAVILMGAQVASGSSREEGVRARWRLLLDTAFVIALGLLLSAVQVLPTAEFARLTDRMDTSYEFVTFLSFPPGNLTRLLVPRLDAPWVIDFDEFGADVGAGALVLVLTALLSRGVWSRARVFPLAGLFSVTLMLGKYLPFYGWYLRVFPPLGIFRAPARAEIILNLTLAVMAGLAIDDVFRNGRSGARRALLAGGMVLLGIGLVAMALGESTVPVVRAALFVTAATAILGWIHLRPSTRFAVIVPFLIPLLVYGELYAAHHSRVPVNEVRGVEQGLGLERVSAPLGRYRYFVPYEPFLDRGLSFGFEDVNGYAPLVVGRYYRLIATLSGVRPDPIRGHVLPEKAAASPHPFLGQLLNVRYVLLPGGQWHEFTSPGLLPRVRFVEQVVERIFPLDQLAVLSSDTFDLATTAVVGRIPSVLAPPVVRAEGSEAVAPTAEVVTYEPERIAVRVSTDRPRLLVFSEVSYPGWIASVDGRPAPVITTNFAFRGVVVPAGANRVVLEFEPLSLVAGAVLSVGALGFVTLVVYRTRRGAGQGRGRGVLMSATT